MIIEKRFSARRTTFLSERRAGPERSLGVSV